MGKNNGNSWLNAVKKAFRSPVNDEEKRSSRRREENDHEEEEKKRGKKRWIFRKNFPIETTIQHNVAKSANSSAVTIPTVTSGEDNLVAKPKQPKALHSVSEQKRAIAVATAAVATARAAVEIIRLTRPSLLVKEHKAAVVIQTIFRGYLARRALLALKGVVKLQALIRGYNVRKRAKMTLQCIQSLVRIQAQVCDQRRRLSCEATSLSSMFSQTNTSRKPICGNGTNTSNNVEAIEEIKALMQKAKECSLKHGHTLAHALSHQMWTLDDDQFSDKNYEDLEQQEQRLSCKKTTHPCVRKDKNLCNQKDPTKTLEIDTSRPYSFTSLNSHFIPSSPLHRKHDNLSINSPRTPKIKSHLESPRYQNCSRRMRMSENSCPLPRPSYMAATASAMARVRSHSTPRQRGSSPSLEQIGSAKKRLSFPVPDGDDKVNVHRYKGICEGQFGKERTSNVPYYYTE